jgi:hypothetical protein
MNTQQSHLSSADSSVQVLPVDPHSNRKDGKSIVMIYQSENELNDLVVGMAKGVGSIRKQHLNVERLGDDKVRIRFS